MNNTDSVPCCIEPGDDQDQDQDQVQDHDQDLALPLPLPLYVSRQVDDETHRAQEARKRLLAAAVLQQQRIDALNND